jgi:hypothetical protein
MSMKRSLGEKSFNVSVAAQEACDDAPGSGPDEPPIESTPLDSDAFMPGDDNGTLSSNEGMI